MTGSRPLSTNLLPSPFPPDFFGSYGDCLIVSLYARTTRLHVLTLYACNEHIAAKEREKAAKAQAQQAKKGATPGATPTKKAPPGSRKTPSTPAANTTKKVVAVDQSQLDIAGLNLNDEAPAEVIPDEPAKPPAAVEKLIEEAKAVLAAKEKGEKRSLSMVVVGMYAPVVP